MSDFKYKITMQLNDLNFEKYIYEIQIVQERPLSYPLLNVFFSMDIQDLLLKNSLDYESIYKLRLEVLDGNKPDTPIKVYDWNLIEYKRDVVYPTIYKNTIKEAQEYPYVSIQFVFKEHQDVLSNTYSESYKDTTLKSIISEFAKKTSTKIKWVSEPLDTKVYQFFFNQQSIITQINQLNYYYGLFDDGLFYQFDIKTKNDNELTLQKLSDLVNQNKEIKKIYFLDGNNPSDQFDEIANGKQYFTTTKPNYGIENNAILQQTANEYLGVQKPIDNLYENFSYKIDDLVNKSSKNSLKFKNNVKFNQHDILKKRSIQSFDLFDNQENQMNQFLNSQISNLIFTTLEISGQFHIEDFSIGTIVELYNNNPYYKRITGKFMIDRITTIFSRHGQDYWINTTKINQIRTNEME